jgi:transcriptional regulator with XRE-family HTH domain
MAARNAKDGTSTVGQVIREYRKIRGVTQKQFASELGVEARTLRMYENGERALENITDLRRIAELLKIDPAELGLAASPSDAYTAREVDEIVKHIASLMLQARFVEARTTGETLLHSLKKQARQEEAPFLHALASAHCIAGHVQAITRKTREVQYIIQHYQEMAKIAQVLENQTLLTLALSYHADMLRRRGDVAQAMAYLEKARATAPLADVAARGIYALLLAQVHLANRDDSSFFAEMARAEELAQTLDSGIDTTLAQFSLGSVYAEYGRGYGLLGNLEKSQSYLQLAERFLPTSNLWNLLLKTTRAEALVHAGEIANAMPILLEVTHLAQTYGHQRLIERLYRLQYYLDDQATLLRQASRTLSEALHGPVEL